MSFEDNNGLEIQTEGQADWDTGLNANFNIIGRGHHFQQAAVSGINSGDVVAVVSGGVAPYNAMSMDLGLPAGMSPVAVSSGALGRFLHMGSITSIDIWSGHLVPGLAVYVDTTTPGFITSSRDAGGYQVGFSNGTVNAVFHPSNPFPRKITQVASFAGIVGSAHYFAMEVGARGHVRELRIQTDSCDAYKVQLFPTSDTSVASGFLYNTLTTSVNGGASDYDITSLYYADAAGFPYQSLDTNSPTYIYGLVSVQSASSVGSSNFSATAIVERFR